VVSRPTAEANTRIRSITDIGLDCFYRNSASEVSQKAMLE